MKKNSLLVIICSIMLIFSLVHKQSHADTIDDYLQESGIQLYNQNYHKALSIAFKALDASKKTHGLASAKTAFVLSRIGSAYSYMGNYKQALFYHNKALEIQKKLLGDTHEMVAASINNIGLVQYHLGNIIGAINSYDQALGIYGKTLPANHAYIGVLYINRGRAYDSLANYAQAVDSYNRALVILGKNYQPDNNYFAIVYNALGDSYTNMGDYAKAIDNLSKALHNRVKNFGTTHPDIATTYLSFGHVYNLKGEYKKAVSYFNEALTIYKKKFGNTYPSVGMTYSYLGNVYNTIGKYEDAEKAQLLALAIYRKIYGKRNLYNASIYLNLGEIYRFKGQYEKALEHHKFAIQIYKSYNFIEHTYTGIAYNYLGGVYKDMGEYAQALHHFELSLAIYKKNLKNNHSYIGTAYVNIGAVYELMREYDKALSFYKQALAIYFQQLGKDHSFVATVYNNTGLCYYYQANYKEAIAVYEKALVLYSNKLGERHPYVANVYGNMALVYQRKGNIHKAIELKEKALRILQKSVNRDHFIINLADLASLYRKIKKHDTAKSLLRKAISVILKYRMQLGRGKAGFLSRYMYIFNELFEYEYKQKNYAKAFAIDSLKRGLSISEGLRLRDAMLRGGVTKEEMNQVVMYSDKIHELHSEHGLLINSMQYKEADKLLVRIWDLETKMLAFDKQLIKKYMEYALLREPKIPSAQEIREKLQPDELMLSYSIIGNYCLYFAITKRYGLNVFTLAQKKDDLLLDAKNIHTLMKYPAKRALLKKIQTKDNRVLLWNKQNDRDLYIVKGQNVFGLFRQKESVSSENTKGDHYNEKKIGILKEDMSGKKIQQHRDRLAKKLYNMLLHPVLKKYSFVKKLIIIPDKDLYYVPFGLLQDSSGRMLNAAFSYSISHSPIVWYKLKGTPPKQYKYPLLAIGNAVYNDKHSDNYTGTTRGTIRSSNTDGLTPQDRLGRYNRFSSFRKTKLKNLPGTEQEIKMIVAIAYNRQESVEEHLLKGINASEDIMFSKNQHGQLEEYKIIHFAAHGLFVDNFPAMNSIILTQPDVVSTYKQKEYDIYKSKHGELKKDGYLLLDEVKTLHLSAELVVMSACETSVGNEKAGEGMVGLPQAFLIAGARSVVASLWSVDDEATALFMQEFYKNIFVNKLKPAQALRMAQVELSKEYNDPFYWAAFVMYGGY